MTLKVEVPLMPLLALVSVLVLPSPQCTTAEKSLISGLLLASVKVISVLLKLTPSVGEGGVKVLVVSAASLTLKVVPVLMDEPPSSAIVREPFRPVASSA